MEGPSAVTVRLMASSGACAQQEVQDAAQHTSARQLQARCQQAQSWTHCGPEHQPTLGDSHTTASVKTAGRRSSTVRGCAALLSLPAASPAAVAAAAAACAALP